MAATGKLEVLGTQQPHGCIAVAMASPWAWLRPQMCVLHTDMVLHVTHGPSLNQAPELSPHRGPVRCGVWSRDHSP